MHFSLQSCISL